MALIEFLKAGVLQAPRAVTSAKHNDEEEVGFLTPSFDEGSLLLRDQAGDYVRLDWQKPQRSSSDRKDSRAEADRRRPLLPGKYTLTNYRIARRNADGHEWSTSATGRMIRQIEVVAGQEQRVEVKAEIAMNCRARPVREGSDVQVTISGEHHAGLTIYRDGQRIPLGFVVRDAEGKELTTSPMRYG